MQKLLLILIVTLAAFPARADTKNNPKVVLTFGIVPQQAAIKTARLWSPIFRYLSEQTGYVIKLKTAPNIPIFEKRVAAGEYDIAYMNPYHYVVFSQSPGYRAFAKQKDKRIVGILVSRNVDSQKDVSALDGKVLAFPSPAAFAASILPRAFLKKQGVAFIPKYVKSHDSVYRNVAKGFFPAGGGIIRTLKSAEPDIRKQLVTLWKSPGYTPHAFAAHPRVAASVVRRLGEVMVLMGEIPKGREYLKAIKFKGVVEAKTEDWDDVRALDIHLLGASLTKAGK